MVCLWIRLVRILKLDRGHGTTQIDFMGFELVAKSVSYDGHEVGGLAKSSVDLLPFHIYQLTDPAQPEPTDGAKLILRRDVENLVDEISLSQALVQ